MPDENGFNLMHNITVLGFVHTFEILKNYGCELNNPSLNGITPLQIAIALNKEVSKKKKIINFYWIYIYIFYIKNKEIL